MRKRAHEISRGDIVLGSIHEDEEGPYGRAHMYEFPYVVLSKPTRSTTTASSWCHAFSPEQAVIARFWFEDYIYEVA